MANPFIDEDRSPFLSFLDTIARPGQVVRNVLKGRGESALRQTGQLGLDIIDSVLPGDWLPNDLAREEDSVSGTDLLGLEDEGFLNKALGFGAEVLTDPLTFVPGAAVAKGLGAAGKAVGAGVKAIDKVVPGAEKAVDAFGRGVRSTFGAQRIKPETRAILDRARAAKTNEAQAGISAIKASPISGMSEAELGIVSDVIDNRVWKDGKLAGTLADDATSAIDRVASHPEVTAANADRIRQAVSEAVTIGQNQAKRPGVFKPGELPKDYLQRQYTGQLDDEVAGEALGQPSAVKGRTLDTFEKQQEFLTNNPDVKYERNAAVRLSKRAEQQGSLAQKAEIGKAIFGKDFAYADPEMRSAVVKNIEAMAEASPEDAQVLMDAFKGIAPRGTVMSWLAKANRVFKPAAVYGFAIPKFGSMVRNAVGGVWQAASNPGSRGVAMKQLGKLDSTLGGAVADSLGLTYPRDQLVKVLRAVDQAFSQSAGSADNALAMLEQVGTKEAQDAAGVIRSGVLDGFVTSEGMVQEMARSPLKKKLASIADWPGRMFRGVEDRMRAGMYLDLVGKGTVPEEAAKIVRDSLYDYSVSSIGNRRARDLIPFFQFSAKAIPQQAKLLAEKPALAVAMSSALGGNDDDPVYPYLEGKLNVPLGQDAEGNQQYASGFGLPFEALNTIPGSFRDVKRNVVGSSTPPLKSLFAAISGEDPYFETQYGSYDKMPVLGHQGDLGSAYNMAAGTGLIQPIDSPLRSIDQLLDDRRSPGIKALDMLTGAKVVSVDSDLALQQQLQEALKDNPDVRQHRSFYAQEGDDATDAMIKEWLEAKARVKAKRAASD